MGDDGRRNHEPPTGRRQLDRREFLSSIGLAAAGGVIAGLSIFDRMGAPPAAGAPVAAPRPNTGALLADEMRSPTVLPHAITTRADFLRRFTPDVHEVWRHGVSVLG